METSRYVPHQNHALEGLMSSVALFNDDVAVSVVNYNSGTLLARQTRGRARVSTPLHDTKGNVFRVAFYLFRLLKGSIRRVLDAPRLGAIRRACHCLFATVKVEQVRPRKAQGTENRGLIGDSARD